MKTSFNTINPKHATKNIFKTLLLICCAALFLPLQAVNVFTETVHFSVDQSFLKNSEKLKLEKLLKATQIQLIGYTDSDGEELYNLKLSKKRVQSVLDFLVKADFPEGKIEMRFKGENEALNKNQTAKEKADNRRVEIKYIKDPLLSFEVESQIFEVKNKAETYIKGKDGTEIYIPAHTFAESDVKIELKEYYSALDILCSNLSTQSNALPIETSGMVHLKAFTENGEEVAAQDKMLISFKNNTGKNDFEFFEGARDENMQVNWVVDRSKPNRDWFASDFFRNNFSNTTKKNIIVSWLNTKNDLKLFDWMKYFSPNEFIEPLNLKCFKETAADIDLDEFGNIIAVSMVSDTPMLKCDKLLEKGRRKLFDKGMKIDPEDYVLDFKVLDLTHANRSILKAMQNASSKAAKDSLMAALEVVEQNTETVQFLTQKLGWINCDRFIRNEKNINYVVEVPKEMNVRMIVKEYNAYFNSYRKTGNTYQFVNIPEGQEIVLICTRFDESGNIEVAIEETTVQKEPFSDFKFEVVSKNELKTRISTM